MRMNSVLALVAVATIALCNACTTVAGNSGTADWQSGDTQVATADAGNGDVLHNDTIGQQSTHNDTFTADVTTPPPVDQVAQPATCGLDPTVINGKYNVIDVVYPKPSMLAELVYYDDGTCGVYISYNESGQGLGNWSEDRLKFQNPILELHNKDGSLMVRMEKAVN